MRVRRIYDLSHKITPMVYHPAGFPVFEQYETYEAHGCRSARIKVTLHFATHLDVPWHFCKDGRKLEDVKMSELVGPGVVLDVSDKFAPSDEKNRTIGAEDLEAAEKKLETPIRPGDMVFINTGWHHLYSENPLRYYSDFHGLGDEAGRWLASKKVCLVGVDICDVDERRWFAAPPFRPPNHAKNLLPNGIFVIENVGGELDAILNRRLTFVVAPLNIAGEFGASSPIRLIAIEAD